MTRRAAQTSQASDSFGCLLALFFLVAVGIAAYFLFFLPDNERLAGQYHIPKGRVFVQPKPHGCSYNDAPLGDKHCHYEKHITVYSKDGAVIEKDGSHATQCPSCAVWNVEETWERVEE